MVIPIRHRLFPHAAYVPPAATEPDIVRHSAACMEGTACMESQRPRFELKAKSQGQVSGSLSYIEPHSADSEIGMQARLTRSNVVVGALGVWWLAGFGRSQAKNVCGVWVRQTEGGPNKHIITYPPLSLVSGLLCSGVVFLKKIGAVDKAAGTAGACSELLLALRQRAAKDQCRSLLYSIGPQLGPNRRQPNSPVGCGTLQRGVPTSFSSGFAFFWTTVESLEATLSRP